MRVSSRILTIVVGAGVSLGVLGLLFAQQTFSCPEAENACSYSKNTWICYGNCGSPCTGANDIYTGAKIYGLETPGAFNQASQGFVLCHYTINCVPSNPTVGQSCQTDAGDMYCRWATPNDSCWYCDGAGATTPYQQFTWTCFNSGG